MLKAVDRTMTIEGVRVAAKSGGKSGEAQRRRRGVISFDEALERVFAIAKPLGAEEVPLAEAHGRVLAAPVTALVSAPPRKSGARHGHLAAKI